MTLEITRGTNAKPVATDDLATTMARTHSEHGHLFIGYPIVGTATGPFFIDALLISPNRGIVIFDLVEGPNPGDYETRQDDNATKVAAMLMLHPELTERRKLRVPVNTISFAPGIQKPSHHASESYPIANRNTLISQLTSFEWSDGDSSTYNSALSAIEHITSLRQPRTKRVVERDGSRGAKLLSLEQSISTLDNSQAKAVIETVDGIQRIRGLAGSGKTVVLALKTAYLHAINPDWRIAVTFNTRSLKQHFRRLIYQFVIAKTGAEPDWERIRVLNAWGAPGAPERTGLYFEFCRRNHIQYLTFRDAAATFGRATAFAGACAQALKDAPASEPLYDAILVDEAQDLPPEFLRLCHSMLDEPKRLVYAYDELQQLSGRSLPPPDEIFGMSGTGSLGAGQLSPTSGAAVPRWDITLDKCYRNSRPVLVTAHALGFGIYRDPPRGAPTGLVQMFDDPRLWGDVGYRSENGPEPRDGQQVRLGRTEKTSSRFLEEHSALDDIVQFRSFETAIEQANWLANSIRQNLDDDELRHDDIMVINPSPRTTRANVGLARRLLLDLGIQSHLAGVDTPPDVFWEDSEMSIPFTGIHRAKGNEAAMVYIINAEESHTGGFNLASLRNQLFTAITRSKAWVRVLGVGDDMRELTSEFERLYANNFTLSFRYPTAAERDHLRVVHRDMTRQDIGVLERSQQQLRDIINELDDRGITPDDLDDDLRSRLRGMLGQ